MDIMKEHNFLQGSEHFCHTWFDSLMQNQHLLDKNRGASDLNKSV